MRYLRYRDLRRLQVLEDHYLLLSPYNLCHVSRRRERVFSRFYCSPRGRPKNRRGRGRQGRRESPIPHLFSFLNLPLLSTLPRRLFVLLRPKRRTKQPLMCRSKSLALIRPLTWVDVLVCWAKPELLFMTFKSSAESCLISPSEGWGRLWYCLLGAFLFPGSFESRSLYK